MKKRIVVITGEKNSGKTSAILRLYDDLKGKIKISGIVEVSPDRKKEKYFLMNLTTKEQKIGVIKRINGFLPLTKAFSEMWEPLLANSHEFNVFFVDEIGLFEQKGEGHAPFLFKLLEKSGFFVLCVRLDVLFSILKKFELEPEFIFFMNNIAYSDLKKIVFDELKNFLT